MVIYKILSLGNTIVILIDKTPLFLRMSSEITLSKTTVYGIKFFFRGRQMDEDSEPPSNLIDDFLDMVISGIACRDWDWEKDEEMEHTSCTEDCAIETCVVIGQPYSNSVEDSLKV